VHRETKTAINKEHTGEDHNLTTLSLMMTESMLIIKKETKGHKENRNTKLNVTGTQPAEFISS